MPIVPPAKLQPVSLDRLVDSYDRILTAVGQRAPDISNATLTSHWPLVGRHFDRGVLIVGQAVFGWVTDWVPSEAATAAGRRRILADSRAVFSELADPMQWIDGHRVEHSPFWRTAHEVVDALTPGDAPWFTRVAWANLYPVAPNDVKGNPTGLLREIQTAPAAGFLDAIVEALEPRLVLVLAGPYIWPFVQPLGLEVLTPHERPFTLVGIRSGRQWICGMHPGGAQRRGWPARQYAQLIVRQATLR